MASATVMAAFAGLKDLLARFHEVCDGDCDDIAGLFSAMSGQKLPAHALYSIMGISPNIVAEAQAAARPVLATR